MRKVRKFSVNYYLLLEIYNRDDFLFQLLKLSIFFFILSFFEAKFFGLIHDKNNFKKKRKSICDKREIHGVIWGSDQEF